MLPVVALLGCGPGSGTEQQAIVGGTTDPNDPAVIAVEADGLQYCSGSLIAPHAVLTAGHCANVAGSLVTYEVVFGPTITATTEKRKVVEQVTHPQYTKEGAPYDFALFKLSAAVSDVAPLPLNAVAMSASNVGQSVRHVGYGISNEVLLTGGGVKRTVTYPITQVNGMLVYSGAPGEQTCTGDSGGPGLMTLGGSEESVALVVSAGPNCHTDGWDDRVDLVMDWIRTTLTLWDPVPDAGVTVDSGTTDGSGDAGADAGADAGQVAESDSGNGGPDAGSGGSGGGGCSQGAAAPMVVAIALWLKPRRRMR
jgi:hypothetical protein